MLIDFLWSLQNPAHRDLAYLLASPSLLDDTMDISVISSAEWWEWFLAAKDWIAADDRAPATLNQLVNTQRRHKLGLYAEDLFLYYLETASPYEVIAHDLQSFIGTRSIGAFDFLLRSPCGRIEHWEMAIKYFVQYTPSTSWKDFIGPGGTDSLQRKMNKMLKRQILLGDRPEAQADLQKKGYPLPELKRIVSVGKLFRAHHQPYVSPIHGAPEQPTGSWTHKTTFLQYLSDNPHKRWVIRQHPQWIAPTLLSYAQDSMSHKEVAHFLHDQQKYVMLSELKNVEHGWQEQKRWFVMPDSWERLDQGQNITDKGK